MSYTLQQFITETHFIPGDTIIRVSCFVKEFSRHFEESNRAFLYIEPHYISLQPDFSFPERNYSQPTLLEIRQYFDNNPKYCQSAFIFQEDDRCTHSEHQGMFYYPEHKCIVIY